MFSILRFSRGDWAILLVVLFLMSMGLISLVSTAPTIFPGYYFYIIAGLIMFWLFSKIDFEILSLFGWHYYVIGIFLLALTLVLGQVTRGTVRWIPLGNLSFQPAEIIRPFLIVFFARYLTSRVIDIKHLLKAVVLLSVPFLLILIQPSLGVAIMTLVGFGGVVLASNINKKQILLFLLAVTAVIPVFYMFLAPYQKARIGSFLDPEKDPKGAGYNSIQSIIAIGSGQLTGRGLGKGVQTQLYFLPEKHTDFIFASIAEEMGFAGSFLVITAIAILLIRLVHYINNPISPQARGYLAGFALVLFVQAMINIGMNLGVFPITGLPLPLVSAGGSSLIGTMIGLGIAVRCTSLTSA